MPHLIDANCFIDARNRYYGFDICPGYWDWLKQQNSAGRIFSVDQIYKEIIGGPDDLAQWGKQVKSNFFLTQNGASIDAYKKIVVWVNANYVQAEQSIFLAGADPFLIAYALAHNFTVVTLERGGQGAKKVKIPDVCRQFNVECIDPFEMMRRENAKLILDPSSVAQSASLMASFSSATASDEVKYEETGGLFEQDYSAFADRDEDE